MLWTVWKAESLLLGSYGISWLVRGPEVPTRKKIIFHVLDSFKAITKYPRSSILKEKGGWLWIRLSDFSLFLCLLVLGRACGENHWWNSCSLHGGWETQRKRKRAGYQHPLQQHVPRDLTSSLCIHLLVPPPPTIFIGYLSSLSHICTCQTLAPNPLVSRGTFQSLMR